MGLVACLLAAGRSLRAAVGKVHVHMSDAAHIFIA
jgi:hypothetical protein